MLIGILSDTHNKLARTQQAIDLLRQNGVQTLIHCGDLTGSEIVIACSVLPCHFVFGNNDADNIPALKEAMATTDSVCLDWAGIVTLEGNRIAVTHGHMHTDVRHLLAAEPDYLLTGHSHIRRDHREGRVRRINPGALHRAKEFSVALLDLATDELLFLMV